MEADTGVAVRQSSPLVQPGRSMAVPMAAFTFYMLAIYTNLGIVVAGRYVGGIVAVLAAFPLFALYISPVPATRWSWGDGSVGRAGAQRGDDQPVAAFRSSNSPIPRFSPRSASHSF
jgi:hypothetical protein